VFCTGRWRSYRAEQNEAGTTQNIIEASTRYLSQATAANEALVKPDARKEICVGFKISMPVTCSTAALFAWHTTLLAMVSNPEYISVAPRREPKQEPSIPASIPSDDAAAWRQHGSGSSNGESACTAEKAMPMKAPPKAEARVLISVTPPPTPGMTLRHVVIKRGLANLTDANSAENP